MARNITMTVHLGEALSEFFAKHVGETGSYEDAGEYVRDLIRRDKERLEQQAFERLKAELIHAFAAPDSTFHALTAAEVMARNKA